MKSICSALHFCPYIFAKVPRPTQLPLHTVDPIHLPRPSLSSLRTSVPTHLSRLTHLYLHICPTLRFCLHT